MILDMNQAKKDFYKNATQNLLSQITKMGLSSQDTQKAVFYTKLFREAFTYDEIKQYTFIEPGADIWDLGYDSAGFCRIASTVFSIALGFNDWKLMKVDADQWDGNASHHYLKHIPSGQFFDLTYDQFAISGMNIPYEIGKPAAYRLYPNNDIMRFANALSIDIIGMLKNQDKRQ